VSGSAQTPDGHIMLFDTGAYYTLIPWIVGESLLCWQSNDPEIVREEQVRIASGDLLKGYVRPARLVILGYEFETDVFWGRTKPEQDIGLLERLGFNRHFDYLGYPADKELYFRWRGHPLYGLQRLLRVGWRQANV